MYSKYIGTHQSNSNIYSKLFSPQTEATAVSAQT